MLGLLTLLPDTQPVSWRLTLPILVVVIVLVLVWAVTRREG